MSCSSLVAEVWQALNRDHTYHPLLPQPQSVTLLWLVLISRPAERRRLSWPRWLGEIPWFISPIKHFSSFSAALYIKWVTNVLIKANNYTSWQRSYQKAHRLVASFPRPAPAPSSYTLHCPGREWHPLRGWIDNKCGNAINYFFREKTRLTD